MIKKTNRLFYSIYKTAGFDIQLKSKALLYFLIIFIPFFVVYTLIDVFVIGLAGLNVSIYAVTHGVIIASSFICFFLLLKGHYQFAADFLTVVVSLFILLSYFSPFFSDVAPSAFSGYALYFYVLLAFSMLFSRKIIIGLLSVIFIVCGIIYYELLGSFGNFPFTDYMSNTRNDLIYSMIIFAIIMSFTRYTYQKIIRTHKKSLELMKLTHDLGISLSSITAIEDAFLHILEATLNATDMDAGGFYMVDKSSSSYSLVVSKNLPEEFLEKTSTLKYPQSLLAVMKKGEPLFIEEKDIPDFVKMGPETDVGFRSVSIIPFIHRNIVLAIMNVASTELPLIRRDSRDAMRAINSHLSNSIARLMAENELHRTKTIESLGIFAGGLAHDFNNILTSILGNISLVKGRIGPDSEEHQILADAEKASLQARGLTRQLLTFSRGGTPHLQSESIEDILKETAGLVLSGSPIFFSLSIQPNLWNALIDRHQIAQVIQNIVINARQALSAGGKITIIAENREMDGNTLLQLEKGKYILLRVMDNGPGIPKEIVHRIFDPYFTTKKEGSGLGLAICHSIVKNHGGHIDVSSIPKKGTEILVYLPATDKPEVQRDKAEEVIPENDGVKNILVIDDDEMILKTVKRLLEAKEFKVTTARDGIDGISLYKKNLGGDSAFDCVILDLTMPNSIGGERAISMLRDIDPGVRAIVASGYSNSPVMSRYREYGFKGKIAKPFDQESLIAAIYRAVHENE